MRRHGKKSVNLNGMYVGKKAVQIIMRVLGRVEQAPVQFNIKRIVFFRICHLVRRGKLVRGRIGGKSVRRQRLMAGEKLAVGDVKIVVAAYAVVLQRIEPAAKLSLDRDGMKCPAARSLA